MWKQSQEHASQTWARKRSPALGETGCRMQQGSGLCRVSDSYRIHFCMSPPQKNEKDFSRTLLRRRWSHVCVTDVKDAALSLQPVLWSHLHLLLYGLVTIFWGGAFCLSAWFVSKTTLSTPCEQATREHLARATVSYMITLWNEKGEVMTSVNPI